MFSFIHLITRAKNTSFCTYCSYICFDLSVHSVIREVQPHTSPHTSCIKALQALQHILDNSTTVVGHFKNITHQPTYSNQTHVHTKDLDSDIKRIVL